MCPSEGTARELGCAILRVIVRRYGTDLVAALTELQKQLQTWTFLRHINDAQIIAVCNAMDEPQDTDLNSLGPTLYYHISRGCGKNSMVAMARYAEGYVRERSPDVSDYIGHASKQWHRRAANLDGTQSWGVPYIGVVGSTRSAAERLAEHRRSVRTPIFGTTAMFSTLLANDQTVAAEDQINIVTRILLTQTDVVGIAQAFTDILWTNPAAGTKPVIAVAETIGIHVFMVHHDYGGGNVLRMYSRFGSGASADSAAEGGRAGARIPPDLEVAMDDEGLSCNCEKPNCKNIKRIEPRASSGFVYEIYAFCQTHSKGTHLFAKALKVDGELKVRSVDNLLDIGVMTYDNQSKSIHNEKSRADITAAVDELSLIHI